MGDHIVDVRVDFVIEEPRGPRRTTVDLAAMVRCCRPERVEELLEDLTLLCEEVQAGRRPEDPGRPALAVIKGAR
jgi:hypothetical protein